MQIESYVNQQQLDMPTLHVVEDVAPVSCFWAAFNAVGIALLTEQAVAYAVKRVEGHYYISNDDVPDASGLRPADLSADQLLSIWS